jgi:hypothetical protein
MKQQHQTHYPATRTGTIALGAHNFSRLRILPVAAGPCAAQPFLATACVLALTHRLGVKADSCALEAHTGSSFGYKLCKEAV